MISVLKKEIEGIVLKKSDYKEQGTITYLLTKDGIVSGIFRGGKKTNAKLNSLNHLFSHNLLIMTTNKSLNTFTDGEVLHNFTILKDDSFKELCALAIYEDLWKFQNSLTEWEQIYQLVLKLLNHLDTLSYPYSLLLLFEIKFWYLIGIAPTFNKCVKCENEGLSFSVENGGMLCSHHLDNSCYSKEISKLLYLIYYIKLNNLNNDFLKIIDDYKGEINKIVNDYYLFHFDYVNKNKKIIDKLL